MAPKSKNTKGGGYTCSEAPRAPASEKPEAKDEESASESESDSEGDGSSDEGPTPEKKGEPRFKTLEEQRAHEVALKEEALADTATIQRLEETRRRREAARIEREAAEKAEAEETARKKAEDEAAHEARQKALSERPILELPAPKDMKAALLRLQDCASDAFLQKHGLKGAGGNKLGKIKHGDFKKIFDDFQENAPMENLHKFKGT
eukprot:TRINITY_DN4002_c0_g1_i1.p1 TRINITY_DN4002_c0_g1~~TRINITY_DN4002_c0_g1_i1.p1  ORF type:complete len:206 (-),score=63.94 TRINITY_DN4002_c0_g1_i1:150-767(-)